MSMHKCCGKGGCREYCARELGRDGRMGAKSIQFNSKSFTQCPTTLLYRLYLSLYVFIYIARYLNSIPVSAEKNSRSDLLIVKDDRRLDAGLVPHRIQRLAEILQGKRMRDDAADVHLATFEVLDRAGQAPHLRVRPVADMSARKHISPY